MRWLVFGLALSLAGVSVQAETVTVRGGEHEGFTRLVLDVPRTVRWRITKAEDLRLTLEGLTAEFDLTSALSKLRANRILSVKPSGTVSELVVDLNCDCEVDSYYAGATMLVIDISGEPLPLQSAAAPAVALATDDTATRPRPRPASAEADIAPEITDITLPLLAGANLPSQMAGSLTSYGSGVNETEEQALADAQRLHETKEKLLRQVSRVAAQGLVEPVSPSIASAQPQHAEPEEKTTETPVTPHPTPDTPGLNMRATSSIDRDYLLTRDTTQYTLNGERCMADRKLDIQNWATEDEFTDQVGALRRALVGEFDKPSVNASVNLAKAYIHFGLGAEAESALGIAQTPKQERHLLALADIVEDGALESPVPGGWFTDCDTAAALWAVLARSDFPDTEAWNETAIERAFGAMPASLRAHIGPFVYEKTKTHRPQAKALLKTLLGLMERGQTDAAPAVQLVAAEQAQANGEERTALAALDAVIEGGGQEAPHALIRKIDALIEQGKPVQKSVQELAAAYTQEYRREALGADLTRVNSLALASIGQIDDALSEFSKVQQDMPSQTATTVGSFILNAVVAEEDNVAFLGHAFAMGDSAFTFEAANENAVADRLLKLGFPKQALSYLEAAATGDTGRTRRLLRAQAALDVEKPRQAEAELLGLTGRDIEDLRAKARVMAQDHRGAQLVYATLGQNDLAAEQAWLGAEWDALQGLETQAWKAEQELLSNAGEADVPPGKALATGRALLENSAGLRADVDALLSRHEVQGALPMN